jgi:hypothetical protein
MSFIYRFDSISNSINLFDFGCSIDYVSGMVEIPSNDLILSHLVSFLHTRTWISIQFPFVIKKHILSQNTTLFKDVINILSFTD